MSIEKIEHGARETLAVWGARDNAFTRRAQSELALIARVRELEAALNLAARAFDGNDPEAAQILATNIMRGGFSEARLEWLSKTLFPAVWARVAELEAAARAIPVGEALPPLVERDDYAESDDVLIFVAGGWHGGRLSDSGQWWSDFWPTAPTHWRPLPAIPGEVPDVT